MRARNLITLKRVKHKLLACDRLAVHTHVLAATLQRASTYEETCSDDPLL
jgi:hypothetical protein